MKGLWTVIFLMALLGCASVRVHNQTETFIDIEADSKNTWLGCSDINPKEENSLMTFYVLDKDITHEFMFRRVIDVDRCLKLERLYHSLTKGVPKVRVVGIHPLDGDDSLITSRVPGKFKDSKVKRTWTFIRLSTVRGCQSYFKGDCKRENYWGGLSPPKNGH